MFRDNKPSRFRTVGSAIVLSIAGLALAGCGGAAAEGKTTTCYEATAENGNGVIATMRQVLHNQARVANLNDLSGFQDTADTINQHLLNQQRDHTLVKDGDKFSVCLTGNDLTPGSAVEVGDN